jgi:hypothetical protein
VWRHGRVLPSDRVEKAERNEERDVRQHVDRPAAEHYARLRRDGELKREQRDDRRDRRNVRQQRCCEA